ncbi:2-phosphosulfolactate phosphatase family protein [Anthocerotibacter panamensis]|uniref:2-phosphosulfolactate phosphatase family protein n=1 Tax=Anthocerotibacter panamensis TaxID=2857077 RepID=UPI001C4057FB|nr:2-phosphosulfolactate phosphatase family protein [Anthocerotibacter panamensis]
MRIFVYHTPELVPQSGLPDCAVVIDVLRATSTIATALNNGAAGVRAYADLTELQGAADTFAPGTCLKAGERGGKSVAGFEMSNSPFEYTTERVKDKWILMSTTNGTRSLTAVREAPVVVTCAFVNLGMVREFLQQSDFETVWIVGSGWEGSYSLEDTCCAGAVAWELGTAGNDEVVAARALYGHWQKDILGLLKQASHGQRLLGLGALEDLIYCSKDALPVLPRQNEAGYLVGTHL